METLYLSESVPYKGYFWIMPSIKLNTIIRNLTGVPTYAANSVISLSTERGQRVIREINNILLEALFNSMISSKNMKSLLIFW